jgi:hypothetical protein
MQVYICLTHAATDSVIKYILLLQTTLRGIRVILVACGCLRETIREHEPQQNKGNYHFLGPLQSL